MKSPVRPSTSSGLPKARAVSTGVSSRPTVPANRPGVLQLVKRQAIGPVAAFTPWNFPAITPARKLSAALAAVAHMHEVALAVAFIVAASLVSCVTCYRMMEPVREDVSQPQE